MYAYPFFLNLTIIPYLSEITAGITLAIISFIASIFLSHWRNRRIAMRRLYTLLNSLNIEDLNSQLSTIESYYCASTITFCAIKPGLYSDNNPLCIYLKKQGFDQVKIWFCETSPQEPEYFAPHLTAHIGRRYIQEKLSPILLKQLQIWHKDNYPNIPEKTAI